MREFNAPPTLRLNIWKQDGKLFFVDTAEFQKTLDCSPYSVTERDRKMGFGIRLIHDLLEGNRIDILAAALVEQGILPGKTPSYPSITPRNCKTAP
jgi:hypothetical protein